MDKITLAQIEKRYQEYLQLKKLERMLIDEINDGANYRKEIQPYHKLYQDGWIDGHGVNPYWTIAPLTQFVLIYKLYQEKDMQYIENQITAMSRYQDHVKREYERKLANTAIQLEIANQALKVLESHEDKE